LWDLRELLENSLARGGKNPKLLLREKEGNKGVKIVLSLGDGGIVEKTDHSGAGAVAP